jgi:predicted nucleic acid-binding protein
VGPTIIPYGDPRIKLPRMDSIYADAAFFVSAHVPGHRWSARAGALLTKLAVSKVEICVTTLVLDELWHTYMRLMYEQRHGAGSWVAGRRDPTVPKVYFLDLEKITRTLMGLPGIRLLPVPDPMPIVADALSLVGSASAFPRDAFHLAVARAHHIGYMVSNDVALQNPAIVTPQIITF